MIIANRKDNKIIQRSSSTLIQDMNGKYCIDEIDLIEPISLSESTSILDVKTYSEDSILNVYKDYTGASINPCPIITDFDSNAVLVSYTTRAQFGHTYNQNAILNLNSDKPGVLITDTITTDNKDKFIVYWKCAEISYSQSVSNGEPTTISYNILEPTELSVYISNDDGATWSEAEYLSPSSFSSSSTTIRLAFVNSSSIKIHLLGYGLVY